MPRAERDLAEIYAAVDAENSEPAFRWFRGLEQAIVSLEHHPGRCALTPESRNLRHLLFGNRPHVYRVIYRVAEQRKLVEILHIRHGARDRFRPGDL